jgi:hypothetical protein
MEAGVRAELAPAIAFLDANGLQDLEEAAGCGKLANADLVDRLDERRRAAVHDRNFFAIDLDQTVVDLKATESCEKMLYRGDRDALFVTDDGAEGEILDVTNLGGDFRGDPTALRDDKTESSVGYCRMQDDRYWSSAMHPRAVNLDLMSNRRLSRANESIRHAAPSLDAFLDMPPCDGLPAPGRCSLPAHPVIPVSLCPWPTLTCRLVFR